MKIMLRRTHKCEVSFFGRKLDSQKNSLPVLAAFSFCSVPRFHKTSGILQNNFHLRICYYHYTDVTLVRLANSRERVCQIATIGTSFGVMPLGFLMKTSISNCKTLSMMAAIKV